MISLCLSSRGGGGGGGGQLFRGRQTLVSVFGDGSVTFVEKQPVFSLGCFRAIIIVLLCSTGQMKADVALLVLDLKGEGALRTQDLQEDPAQMGPGKDKK